MATWRVELPPQLLVQGIPLCVTDRLEGNALFPETFSQYPSSTLSCMFFLRHAVCPTYLPYMH